jgi:chemotaxis protein CheY-P-specific phosphatase CheC
MNLQPESDFWPTLIGHRSANGRLRLAIRHVAHTLSDMVNRPFKVNNLSLETTPLNQLITEADDPEAETVGVYLRTGDDLPGQAILILSLADAMYMTDWLLELRPGTTGKLSPLARSALAETGNLMISSFLNAAAESTSRPLRLSTPQVMVDMLATTLQVVATSVATVTDDLFIIKTEFVNLDSSLSIRLWLLPDPASLALINGPINGGQSLK